MAISRISERGENQTAIRVDGLAGTDIICKGSTYFITISLPGKWKIFEWFDSTASSEELYKFVSNFSDKFRNNNGILRDPDRDKIIDRNKLIKDELKSPNKGSAKKRYYLIAEFQARFIHN